VSARSSTGDFAESVVPVSALADTGALLAYLDRRDRWHSRCREAFAGLRLPLVTTTAVLTELFHLVGARRNEVVAAWEFVRAGFLTVAPVGDRDLPALEALMRRYSDHPMDFADATLVHVAERESIATVFTVDHNDFESYRFAGRRRFRIVPDR
jgi:predicted nucleic acid-binding protein